ncbi:MULTISPECIES: H-NS family nucleoid-associated regulatory protein [unclassified Variovorax]|uniref:H-NS family nucleoid-associated regulatory protein n=1 Tax=unclassified Variovorax TaxID=663243 RepID=UPI0013196F15|nr:MULTISPECIES: H-NS family nucleoid-associated regulatory protein [unclassified Variovorax]VTU42713.1 DNA binding protein, nucleoid-associated [Variovorax sp. PBL-H6]VTU43735.1 DNA binding protein, nucleoid-associated [Variovorax sp. SRS16]VTU43800.1 DNA binding protein, nucleoid-associated [Variovorax sp. PBL-E5]
MTQTYSQLQKQIAALQRQADSVREKEVGGVVARIREAIEHYGLTAEQLFGGKGVKSTKAVKGRTGARVAKFADENGNTWGGMGKRPDWLKKALLSGKSLADFATAGAPKKAASLKLSKAGKKRQAKVSYSDNAGNNWSGMGPRPRWLREALEAGKSLDDFAQKA